MSFAKTKSSKKTILDELEEKVEELRKQPKEEWFDHSAMEATDSLKEAHEQELKELERDLRKAEKSLNALQNHSQEYGCGNARTSPR